MNNKQQQLTFSKGITNVPSDALCSDNTLEESVGLVYSDSEHRVIQKPSLHMTGLNGKTLLYIHVYNDQKRYIVLDGTSLTWGTNASGTYTPGGNLFTVTGTPKITSIGKTLIVSDASGIQYFLWTYDVENDEASIYESLGSNLPNPEVSFLLDESNSTYQERGDADGLIKYDSDEGGFHIENGKKGDWNNLIVGIYSGLRKKVWQDKCFHGSFCIRAALELYDGTYAYVSNPVLMLNHFSEYGVARISFNTHAVTMHMRGQRLLYRFGQDYTKWADIVKNVVLFVTKEAATLDTLSDAICIKGNNPDEGSSTPLPADTPICYYMSYTNSHTGVRVKSDIETLGEDEQYEYLILHRVLKPIPDSEIENVIKDGVYYKLCEIGTIGSGEWKNAGDHFDTHTLENITTQEQLKDEDFYSHCPLKAGLLYSYNSRLNISNVSRGFFDGFSNFMPFDNDLTDGLVPPSPLPAPTYRFRVTIHTDEGLVVVEKTKQTYQRQGIYFYYPDPRARHVDIFKDNTQILHQDMVEHPNLNGAYYFAGVSPTMEEPSSVTVPHEPSLSVEPFERLANYVIQSEVNNPFVFKAAGYFKVGTGKILAMSSVTQALSEGQFGQFPLLVFSESGIWTLAVASTGYYSSVHPMSREVALLDNPCITQTDGAVFFASEKGLMVVVGAQVKCVSEQLSGKANGENISEGAFQDYLKNAFIAYDYRDSLLWIFNPRSGYEEYCYIYSMKTGTFSKYYFTSAITSIVDNYPDYLLQSGTSVFSLLNRPNINSTEESANTYTATMITRPMKLENALALKSIMQVKHIHDMQGSLTLRIFASNKLSQSDSDWVELFSLRGVPWKYYKFRYDFTELKATDRFAGTMLITQERRIDKLR
jgi:hypothetical protein